MKRGGGPAAPENRERLQRLLARHGMGSRRTVETWIAAGRIEVDGEVATLGCTVTGRERITVDGAPLRLRAHAPTRVLLYHKPAGVECSRRSEAGLPTVYDDLPALTQGRWLSVGRLDVATTGLLLFTNDGELANRLAHPSQCVDREYVVRVHGEVDDEMMQRLRDGVLLDDGLARFADIGETRNADDESGNRWFYVTLFEGRNREVRRLWESQGVQVSRLKRVRYGPVVLPPRLRQGRTLELTPKDVTRLAALVEFAPERVGSGRVRGDDRAVSQLVPYPEAEARRAQVDARNRPKEAAVPATGRRPGHTRAEPRVRDEDEEMDTPVAATRPRQARPRATAPPPTPGETRRPTRATPVARTAPVPKATTAPRTTPVRKVVAAPGPTPAPEPASRPTRRQDGTSRSGAPPKRGIVRGRRKRDGA